MKPRLPDDDSRQDAGVAGGRLRDPFVKIQHEGLSSFAQEIEEEVHGLPVDPDVEHPAPGPYQRARGVVRERRDILAVIAVGGALGSLARWGVGEALPHSSTDFAWSTFLNNVPGAFLLGLLMVFIVDVWSTTRLLRPFLGVGVLGGYTTFSTWMLDTRGLVAGGAYLTGLALVLATLLAGLVAVWAGIVIGRVVIIIGTRRAAGRRAHQVDEDPPSQDQQAHEPPPDEAPQLSPRSDSHTRSDP